ncbi:BLOC-1-related complex subunit 6 [Drosophila ficusphila]|uniref:BLOC-1-related complex subunit 6 n=1 Tax=Drosophila ficusphila TaxID=30025 RepID=UPI0007E720C8|nr:BLOC-1-related complex subunit 6 [Drosophila ficusphila]
MSHRHQDIPIRPRYGLDEEANSQAEVSGPSSARSGATPASSYTEIPFLAQYPGAVPDHVLQDLTPTAVGNPAMPGSAGRAPNGESYVNLDSGEDDEEAEENDPAEEEDNSNSNSNSKDSSGGIQMHRRLQADSNLPYELEGTSDSDGMRHFVAHDLEAKLREGVAAAADYSSEHTTPSTSMGHGVPAGMGTSGNGLLTRRFLQSRNIPEVDGSVLSDIELEAQYLATSVDNLLENLGNLLHSISSITADNVEVHRNAVNKLTDTLDANIKCQYQLLAKAEEITKSMKPTEQLGLRIREIKRLVDMLDSTM